MDTKRIGNWVVTVTEPDNREKEMGTLTVSGAHGDWKIVFREDNYMYPTLIQLLDDGDKDKYFEWLFAMWHLTTTTIVDEKMINDLNQAWLDQQQRWNFTARTDETEEEIIEGVKISEEVVNEIKESDA